MTDQTQIDPFRELNRYDDRDADYPSSVVYESPRRTLEHGWRKFHATRECGRGKVAYVEQTSHRPAGSKYASDLYCWQCGHRVDEHEVLFIGGQWYSDHGWQSYGKGIEDLFIPPERVLELGPDPDHSALIDALELCRIEREASLPHMFSFGADFDGDECDECGHTVPIAFDGRCGMCYDGQWSDRLESTLETLARALRERNGSYAHRLETQVDPFEPGDGVLPGTMLWRRHDTEGTTKLVEVIRRLKDVDSGRREYVLSDPTHTERWHYCEADLRDCFWDTGLRNDEVKPVLDDRIRDVWQGVCEHTYRTVHDPETHDPDGEQCISCRDRRE